MILSGLGRGRGMQRMQSRGLMLFFRGHPARGAGEKMLLRRNATDQRKSTRSTVTHRQKGDVFI